MPEELAHWPGWQPDFESEGLDRRSVKRAREEWALAACIAIGSSTVTYEALLSGAPMITTPNAGSIGEDGVNGFVVPIRDHRALPDAIGRYAPDRDLLTTHRAACVAGRERAKPDQYRSNLTAMINSLPLGQLSLADEPRVQFR